MSDLPHNNSFLANLNPNKSFDTKNLGAEKLADHLNEIMNLNLYDFDQTLKSSRFTANGSTTEMSEYFSSPSKSSTHEYSPPESCKLSSATNCLNKDSLISSRMIEECEAESENDSEKHITKLFVGNLPTSTTLPELLAVFKKFGPVNEALSVVKDHNYAFIHFYNRKDAEVALREVNDSLFKDRYIRVQFSTSQGFTNNKNKGLDKRRSLMGASFSNSTSMESLGKQYVYPSQSMPFSYSNQSISQPSSNPFTANNFNSFNSKISRPITGNRFPHSQTTFFYDKNASNQSNYSNSSSQSNLLIEASKLQNFNLNSYSQYHEELQQKQQLIQAIYLKQQQQILQQQLQQQILKNQQQQGFRIPKSNTIGSFNLNYSGFGSNSTLNQIEQINRLMPGLGQNRRENNSGQMNGDKYFSSNNLNSM